MNEQNIVFDVAAGSVPGRDHLFRDTLLIGKNNQDGYAWRRLGEQAVCIVVSDGCGSHADSEVGAKLTAALTASVIERRLEGRRFFNLDETFFEICRQDVLAQLRVLALSLAGKQSFTETVARNFLATVVGALVSPDTTWLFYAGDGLIAVDGEIRSLGPFPENRPPYPAYTLIDSAFAATPELLRYTVERREGPVQSVAVGTDGALQLLKLEGRPIPGSDELVGPLAQFWTEGRYFSNKDALRRRLARINSQSLTLDRLNRPTLSPGLLADDTTLVVARRHSKT
jgi:hypothetical protein